MCDGWLMVTNSDGESLFKSRYKTRRELARAEHEVSVLIELPGARWARGSTEEDVRSRIADQISRAKEAQNVGRNGEKG
jgi:hypothetical protein